MQGVGLSVSRRHSARSVRDLFKPDIRGTADAQDVISFGHKWKREAGLTVGNPGLSCRGLVVGKYQGKRCLIEHMTVALHGDDPLYLVQLRKRQYDIFTRSFLSRLERERLGGVGPQGVARVDGEGIVSEITEG